MNCPQCGTNVDDRASFCPVCGTRLNASAQQPFSAQPPQAPVPPQPYYGQSYQQAPYGGYRAPITNRSIPVAIILSIVTCGIYALYWLYCIVTDLNIASGETDDTSGGMVLLLSIVTCDIYLLYWMYQAGKKVNRVHAYSGTSQDSSTGILYLILTLIGLNIVSMALIQSELNKVANA